MRLPAFAVCHEMRTIIVLHKPHVNMLDDLKYELLIKCGLILKI